MRTDRKAKFLVHLVILALTTSSCTSLFGSSASAPGDKDNLEVFVSEGRSVVAESKGHQLLVILDEQGTLDTSGVVVTLVDLGSAYMIETADPEGRYLPAVRLTPRTADDMQEVIIQQIPADSNWSIHRTASVPLWLLDERYLDSIPLASLGDLLSANTYGRGVNILLQIPDTLAAADQVSVYRAPGSMTFLVVGRSNTTASGSSLLSTVAPEDVKLAAVGALIESFNSLQPASLVQVAMSLPSEIAGAEVVPTALPTDTPVPSMTPIVCAEGETIVINQGDDGPQQSCQPIPTPATETPLIPTETQAPTPTPSPVPPSATPTVEPVIYTETFREVSADILGDCPAWVHDRYVATGPDGNTYRTWHPVVVSLYADDPESPKCTMAHEHGDPPHPDAPAPFFGYVAYHADRSDLIDEHAGYKVFTHMQGQRTGWGYDELIGVNPDADTQLWIHMGTASKLRLSEQYRGAGFWSVDAAGNRTEVYYFADTGVLADKCDGVQPGRAARYVASQCDFGSELWSFEVTIADAWISPAHVSVLNPMTFMIGDLSNPAEMELLSTSEFICGVNFLPCAYKLPFGHSNSVWLGNSRLLLSPEWQWTNLNGDPTYCTDVYGKRADNSMCNDATRGYFRQQIPTINFFGGKSIVWDRSTDAVGNLLGLPLGAPGGN